MIKFVFLIFGLLANFYSSACSCIGKQSVSEALKASDLVVSARIVGLQKIKIWDDTSIVQWNYNPAVDTISFEQYKFEEENYGIHELEYTIVVESSFKGAKQGDTLKIRTGYGGGDCGFPFDLGKKYLIYAVFAYSINYSEKKSGESKKELQGVFNTDICQRTQSLKNAAKDLKYLESR